MRQDKVVKGVYSRLLEDTAQRCLPFTALCELTYLCNTRCEHCYVVRRDKNKELTTEEVFSILEQLADEGVLFLTFSGGEPLVRRDFFDIALKARSLDFALRIFTNGTLVDTEVSRKIAGLDPLEVEVSLYGSTAGTHDRVTGVRGSFYRTMSGVRNLLRDGVRVNLKAPLMKSNHSEYPGMKGLAEGLGALFFHDTQIVPRDDGDPCPMSLNMDDNAIEIFYLTEKKKERQKKHSEPEAHAPRAQAFSHQQSAKEFMDQPFCNAGRNTLVISPSGDVYPCIQIRWKAGNLREKSLGHIWRYSPVLEKVRRLNMKDFEECMACGLFAYCSHCPGVSLLETGRILGCSPLARSQASVLCSTMEREGCNPRSPLPVAMLNPPCNASQQGAPAGNPAPFGGCPAPQQGAPPPLVKGGSRGDYL